jgi:hypothetical protein
MPPVSGSAGAPSGELLLLLVPAIATAAAAAAAAAVSGCLSLLSEPLPIWLLASPLPCWPDPGPPLVLAAASPQSRLLVDGAPLPAAGAGCGQQASSSGGAGPAALLL